MDKIYEDSHDENIDRFMKIINACIAFEEKYNPKYEAIFISNMTTKWTEVVALQSKYSRDWAALANAVNNRQVLFKSMKKIAVRTKDFLDGSDVSDATIKDVKAKVRLITGSNVRKRKLKEGEAVKKWVSNSHLGFDNMAKNFGLLIEIYRNEPEYDPNEPILKIAHLDEMLVELRTASDTVNKLNAIFKIAMDERDYGLYDEGEGLVDISLKCKKYVRAVFGPKSPEAKNVSKIKLKRFKRLNKAKSE
jgi:alkylhydroperoxidase/carboxymuconolactone decarboxylase family protein YurZ